MMRLITYFFTIVILTVFVHSQTDEGTFNTGLNALQNRDFQKAVEIFTELSAKYPDNDELRLNKAISNFYLGDLEKASNDFTILINKDPQNSNALNFRGLIYSYSNNYKKAIEDFNNAIKFDNNFAEAYINRGNVYLQMQEFNNALADYNSAENYDKKNPMLYVQRAAIMHRMKKYNKAVSDFQKAIDLGFKDAKIYADIGNSYFKLRNYQKAVDNYNIAIKLDPNDLKSINNRSVAHFELGNKEKAEQDKILFAQKMQEKYKPFEQIEFNKIDDANNEISLEIPNEWYFYQVQSSNDETEFYVTKDDFKNTGNYEIGGMFYLVKNASAKFDVKNEQDLILYWNNKRLEEAENFTSYGYIQKKQFPVKGFPAELNIVKAIYQKGGQELAVYEFAVAYGDNLLIAYLQSPIGDFEYYRQIYDKMIKSIEYNFPTAY